CEINFDLSFNVSNELVGIGSGFTSERDKLEATCCKAEFNLNPLTTTPAIHDVTVQSFSFVEILRGAFKL
ncbi:MAG: hypothetical protein ACXV5H_12665, partial [Halobacteriota archaeon]